MKVKIDEEMCISCGLCSQICPRAFAARKSDEIAVVVASEKELDQIDCVKEAIDSCPTGAIVTANGN